ncbi:MAG: AAA family ATPase [Kiritimatiellaeota bacterium]|nr:AAA family ATPase [Kiritimatiellota bacterium]
MNFTPTLRFALLRAEAEAAIHRSSHPTVEHLFLGLLKLAEITSDDFALGSRHRDQNNDDIAKVKALFDGADIFTKQTRDRLRRALRQKAAAGDAVLAMPTAEQWLEAELAAVAGQDTPITACMAAEKILAAPTPMIRDMCQLDEKANRPAPPPPSPVASADPDENRARLPELTEQVRKLRNGLLASVRGQDQAIHAFSDGIFSAEVLAAADETRKRPRALFIFVGPPGVGKTFLAEKSAEALGLPFKRFDMSGFSDHQQHNALVGFSPSYQAAKPGTLTEFVKKNPRCVLLFDEIEKAHTNTINLFLQILDAGMLHDNFRDEDITFKDTVIIFTTNAGKQLYDDGHSSGITGISRKVIIEALEAETQPQSGRTAFPAAICSRLATGWPVLFNHLGADVLEGISEDGLTHCATLFKKQYGVRVEFDERLPVVLLCAEGGAVDARTLRAQSELFFKNEVFKFCRLFNEQDANEAITKLGVLRFTVETARLPSEITALFQPVEKPEVLIFADRADTGRCAEILHEQCTVHPAHTHEEVMRILGERDISLVLLDPSAGAAPATESVTASAAFPLGIPHVRAGRTLFLQLRERIPELPVYLLETERLKMEGELLSSFESLGARGKIAGPSGEGDVFREEVEAICKRLHLQKTAEQLASERKVLCFETAPRHHTERNTTEIRLRDFSLRQAVAAADAHEVLSDYEKPKTRFPDVIGAGDAKDELAFFVNYLRNPKKSLAAGLQPPKGVLLYGPPGTGKTLLARALAGESGVTFIPATASAFVTKWQGSGPESVRALFARARRYAPSIVFIDEIDAVGRARSGHGSAHAEEMALNALLTELDGFSNSGSKRPVFVLAATNFEIEEGRKGIGTLDPALVRRFDRQIRIDLPTKDERRQYLAMKLAKRDGVTEASLTAMANRTAGMSLAGIESVLATANRLAAKRNAALSDTLLEEALELSRFGERKDWGAAYMERVARHEAGHALMNALAGRIPTYLTIIARGDHGGYSEDAEGAETPLQTREQLAASIRTALGGRAAELMCYGDRDGLSTGASNDLRKATRVARAMTCDYGMDSDIGPVALSPEEAASGPLAEHVSRSVAKLLRDELAQTLACLTAERRTFDTLVTALLEKNKLNREELAELLGGMKNNTDPVDADTPRTVVPFNDADGSRPSPGSAET